MDREKFLEDYNEPLMQAVEFTYNFKKYMQCHSDRYGYCFCILCK